MAKKIVFLSGINFPLQSLSFSKSKSNMHCGSENDLLFENLLGWGFTYSLIALLKIHNDLLIL